MIARFVRRAKLRGVPHRVLYLVGTHKLAAEARLKMPDGVTTAIWQGRDAIKLGTVDEKMCLNPEAVKAAIDIGAVIEEHTPAAKPGAARETIELPRSIPSAITKLKRRWPGKPTWLFAAH